MKKLLFIFLVQFLAWNAFSQTYTIYKTGPNTWGGPYVPPVWSKTYDFNSKPYSAPSQNYSSPSSFSYSSSSGGSYYVKRNKWSITSGSGPGGGPSFAEMEETLKEAMDIYFRELDESIKLFNQGEYETSQEKIGRLDINAQKTKRSFDEFNVIGIQEKYTTATFEYMYVKYCYKYFCNVKLHQYEDALDLYNSFFSSYQVSGSTMDTKTVWPLTPEYYYVFDPQDGPNKQGFKNIIPADRFRADLFLVETLVGLGKVAEAAQIMEKTMTFYTPMFKELDYFLPQIAINYFYLGNAEESRKYLEFYCHKNQSNTARLAIVNELLHNEKIKWDQASSPQGYKLIEDNILFLDSLQRAGQNIEKFYSLKTWFELFVNRSKNADKFITKADNEIGDVFAYKVRRYGRYEFEEGADEYLIALLNNGDEARLNAVMEKIAATADGILKSELEQLPGALQKHEEGKSTYTSPARYYWYEYNQIKARPYSMALQVFFFPKFAHAGGGEIPREICGRLPEGIEQVHVRRSEPPAVLQAGKRSRAQVQEQRVEKIPEKAVSALTLSSRSPTAQPAASPNCIPRKCPARR